MMKLLFQIYFTVVTFHAVASQRGGGQFEVALHATALGANRNNCGRMQEQAWVRTCWVRTCTGREHVGRQHVPVVNMSDSNMSGANLTPFFSKNTPKLPFLVEEAQMNFYFYFFCTFNCRILP
jgi:hypothetical protein